MTRSLYEALASSQKKNGDEAFGMLTEKHLQVIWLEQKHLLPLVTTDGKPIKILSPGLWNTEAGPDFLRAHFEIEGKAYRGDVEIHLHEEGWTGHGHDQDERYNQVLLHVSLWPAKARAPIYTYGGEKIISVYLADRFMLSPVQLLQQIDLDLYPYRRFAGTGRCADQLFKELSIDHVGELMQAAAYWRLERKQEYLQSRWQTPSMQLAGGIAMALGYKANAEAFGELFQFLIDYRDLTCNELLAIGMGVCGFFDRSKKEVWLQSAYYQELQHLWWGHQHQVTHQANLKLDHIRPLNHPLRRLVYLAKLLQDPAMEQIWDRCLQLWKRVADREQTKHWTTRLKQELLQLIPAYEDEYWSQHFNFESLEFARARPLSLLGKDVREQILLNTVLPLLYHEMGASEMFAEFYRSLKGTDTSKARYLRHRFFGEMPARELLDRAEMIQGAYQLHKDFCLHYEASCEGCPFVDRYVQLKALL